MATNHTPNYQLSQWEKSDKVLMDDFNEDNAKIDEALAELSKTSAKHDAVISKMNSCVVTYTDYPGGELFKDVVGFHYSFRPVLLIITGGEYLITIQYRAATGQCRDGHGNFCEIPLTWKEHGVSWKTTPDMAALQGDGKGIEYHLTTVLDTRY